MKMKTIERLLVANRGEIARRIMRSCRDLGIVTVAVYSDADADAAHVREADLSVRLGPAPSAQSYLLMDKLLEAAALTGADAIHPGYGFLAENAAFAQKVQDAGLVWVGPSPAVITSMGSKQRARAIAQEAGVPVVPGYSGAQQDDATLVAEAGGVGYPLLVKASAGGGGKGMRIVHGPDELEAAIGAARREAKASFGDDTLMLERYVSSPRHIEFQILGDVQGNLVHLFERECSIQRRYQKVIEETPSMALDDALRQEMGAAAVSLGRSMAYTGAGTVEFILDGDGRFYFLEVNTRLQVEHPVTEEVTGVDLVAAQIRVAEGRPLGFVQEDLVQRGAALECRLYAEDTAAGFLPSTGRLADWFVPEMEGLRVDSGVESGDEISTHYDPMIAKVITFGSDREGARRRMLRALRGICTAGVKTNQAFLLDVLSHEAYKSGEISTHFIDEHMQDAMARPLPRARVVEAVCAAVLAAWAQRKGQRRVLPSVRPGFRNNFVQRHEVKFALGDEILSAGYRAEGDGLSVMLGEDSFALSLVSWDAPWLQWCVEETGLRMRARVVMDEKRVVVSGLEGSVTLAVVPRFVEPGAQVPKGACTAPMPGRVVSVHVEEGQEVSQGQVLLVLEAMKMEHPVQAPRDGVVAKVLVSADQQVEVDAPLVVLEPLTDEEARGQSPDEK